MIWGDYDFEKIKKIKFTAGIDDENIKCKNLFLKMGFI